MKNRQIVINQKYQECPYCNVMCYSANKLKEHIKTSHPTEGSVYLKQRKEVLSTIKRRNKYGNVTCIRDGKTFDSRKEGDYYTELKIKKRVGIIVDFERQVVFDLIVNGKRICQIVVDYLLHLPGGVKEVHEVKSEATMTREWDIKRKLFKVLYPQIEYKIIL